MISDVAKKALVPAIVVTILIEPLLWILLSNSLTDLLAGNYACNFFDSSRACTLRELLIGAVLFSGLFNVITLGLYTIVPAIPVYILVYLLFLIGERLTGTLTKRSQFGLASLATIIAFATVIAYAWFNQ